MMWSICKLLYKNIFSRQSWSCSAFVHESQICGEALFQSSGIGAEQASTSAENQAPRSLVYESHAEDPVFIR
jgi:hypothetical protein